MNIDASDTQATLILQLLTSNAVNPEKTPDVVDLIYQIESQRRTERQESDDGDV